MGCIEIMRVYMESTPEDRERGLHAYDRYRDRIVTICERRCVYSPVIGCGMFSALSPNNDESGNFRDMAKLLDAYYAGLSLERVNVSTYRLNRSKAIRILHGEPPLQVLHGLKTRAFYECLLNPSDNHTVVVDGHIYSVWRGRRFTMDKANVTKSEYERIANDFRYVASQIGIIPSALQATCWFAWKREQKVLYKSGGSQLHLPLCDPGVSDRTHSPVVRKVLDQSQRVPTPQPVALPQHVFASRDMAKDSRGKTAARMERASPRQQQITLLPVESNSITAKYESTKFNSVPDNRRIP